MQQDATGLHCSGLVVGVGPRQKLFLLHFGLDCVCRLKSYKARHDRVKSNSDYLQTQIRILVRAGTLKLSTSENNEVRVFRMNIYMYVCMHVYMYVDRSKSNAISFPHRSITATTAASQNMVAPQQVIAETWLRPPTQFSAPAPGNPKPQFKQKP